MNGSLTVSDSTISRNTSDISTGAIRILDTSARVYRTEFVENSGSHAAILSIGVTDLLIDDSVFHGNYSLEASVGISTYPAGSVTISNTTFGNGLGKALSAYRAEVDLHDVSISNYDHSIFSGTVFVNHSTLYANSLSVLGTSNGIGALIQSTPSEVRNSTLTHNVVGMELNGNSSFYGRNIRISDSLSSGVEVFGSGGDSPTLSFHLVDSGISNNRTDGIDDLEAGLSISGADFYLDSVSVSGNSSGGGIKVFGSGNGRLVDVSVVGNTAYLGGGVSVKDSGTILEIDNSTISGNTATRGGGLSAQSGSQITIVNSTISENTGVVAGAIYSQASVSLIHSTLTGNHDDGSGSVATSAQGLVSVTNSILASGQNSAACGNQSDIRPYGTNHFQDASCNGIDSGDPMLTEVADNGGPTPTQHPRAGSPVIDTADSAFCPPSDQRGEMRGATPCDLGAVEVVDINQPPRIDDQSFVINTGFMVDDPVGILAFSDPEMLLGADPLTIIGPDQGFRVESDGMVLVDSTIVPGVATLAVEVTDPGGLSDRAAVVIDVIELPLFIDGFEQ